jgi:uncharacterized membrane protein
MKHLRVTFVIALAADAALTLWSWSRMPERVPVHWNVHGDVDRYGSPHELLWIGPGVLLLLWGVAELMRFIDPKMSRAPHPEQTEADRLGSLATVMGIVAGLMVAIHALIIMQSLGIVQQGRRAQALVLAAFCMVFGNFIAKVRPNWFVGIRTPWTLSSDEVWRRTHRMAGWLMVPAGLLGAVGALVLPAVAAMPVAIGLLLASLVVPVVLSYVYWRGAQT